MADASGMFASFEEKWLEANPENANVVVFLPAAQRRLAANVASFDRNDDELRKSVADRAYVDGGYPFDIL